MIITGRPSVKADQSPSPRVFIRRLSSSLFTGLFEIKVTRWLIASLCDGKRITRTSLDMMMSISFSGTRRALLALFSMIVGSACCYTKEYPYANSNLLQTRLINLPSAHRFMKFDRIDWARVFFKTYFKKRSFGHLFVNFNRIFVIHIAMYYFYMAYNSRNVYKIQGHNSAAMTWSATALGGAVATIIMIIATLFEFSYIPTTWNNTSHLTCHLIFLLVTLAITCGPTFYIAIVESHGTGGSLSLILGIIQFFISAIATLKNQPCSTAASIHLPMTKRVRQKLTIFLSILLVSRVLHRNLPFAHVSGLYTGPYLE